LDIQTKYIDKLKSEQTFIDIYTDNMKREITINERKYKSIRNLFLLILILFVFNSCDKVTPAGFWKDYQQDKITNNKSDQGPWGGQRIIKWLNKETFNPKDINEFATKNGWTLIDSLKIDNTIKTKLGNFKNEYSEQIFATTVLTNIKNEAMVYIYKTGWVAIEPGNTDKTEDNGFLTLNADRTELTAYHIWGE
jgi:hypothetical protein